MAKGGKRKLSRRRKGAYKDLNISRLRQHDQNKKTLKPPFAQLKNVHLSSWRDEFLPNVLWAVLLAGNLERTVYLDLFRAVMKAGREQVSNYEETYITHTVISALSDADFDALFSTVLDDDEARKILSALLIFEALPDKKHWQRHLAVPEIGSASEYLARAVMMASDHQSEQATDVRWLRYLCAIMNGKFHFPHEMEEDLKHVYNFPNSGDMRHVRPFIRAGEMTLRAADFEKTINPVAPDNWHASFWLECWKRTECILPVPRRNPDVSTELYFNELMKLYGDVANHFFATNHHTSPDPRHDACFGIALYAINLGVAAGRGHLHHRVEGRMILRTIVEIFLTLSYLLKRDEENLWKVYRNYGAGQAKLTFLKYIEQSSIPKFINLDELHAYANEDAWQEFQSIELGQWANLNLRQMAIACEEKETYDKYYDWPSGYIHGHWSAIRDSNFTNCLNPLHRFHRVPFFPRLAMPTVLPDTGKLINRILDLLNSAYPTFKQRLRAHKEIKSEN